MPRLPPATCSAHRTARPPSRPSTPASKRWSVTRPGCIPSRMRAARLGGSAPFACRTEDAEGQKNRDGRDEDPPHGSVGDAASRIGDRQREQNAQRDQPVVTDDEVVPEAADRAELANHECVALSVVATSALSGEVVADRCRNSATNASAYSATAGTRTSSAASSSGQCAPAPSAPQNIPNAISMTPTANFMLFSGTRDSGARTAMPTTATTSTAATAAAAANGMLC